MPYYPKSQIKTNLYTNGNEYFLSTTQQAYSGYYYELSNGDKFTGKTPEDKENILLKNINPNLDSPFISDLTQKEKIKVDVIFDIINPGYFPPNPPQNRAIPSSNLTIPTQKDYNLGEFQRYFAKKRTENLYLEISKETHDLLKNTDSKIAWDIYTTISLPWDLSGDQTQTYTTNKNTVILIENREKWYGFEVWFKDDFLKYYKTSTIQEDLFTDGTEFINRRTKLTYKGPYHIHPEKGPMVGAKHIQRKHDYLDPIQQTLDTTSTSQPTPTPLPTPTYSGGGGSTSGGGGGYSGGGGGY